MHTKLAAVLLLAVLSPLLSAQEAADAPAVVTAPETLTSNEILYKWADACKSAAAYYEKSDLTIDFTLGDMHEEQHISLTAAYKRPDMLKVDITGDVNAVVFVSGTDVTFLDRTLNKYAKESVTSVEDIADTLDELGLNLTPLSRDPYAVITADSESTSDVETVDYESSPAYKIVVTQSDGIVTTYFFDTATFTIRFFKSEMPLVTPEGDGSVIFTKKCTDILVGALPVKEGGSEADVFAFSLPTDATLFDEPVTIAPEEEFAPDLSSTESDVVVPVVPAE